MRHESSNLSGDKTDPADRVTAHHRLADEFDAWAEAGRGDSMEKGHWGTAEQALARIPFEAVRVFLDVGCGNGYAVRHAATRIPQGGVALGLDVSPAMLEQARSRTESWRMGNGRDAAEVRFLQAPFDAIPLPGGSVDAVFSNEAMYYAPDVNAALAEIHRVLKAGGAFWCGLDYYVENRYSHDWQAKVGLPMTMDSEAGWVRRFEEAGFVDVEAARLLDPSGVPPLAPDADDAARDKHAHLLTWKTTVGSLLLIGRKD